ncbi:ureidoglycolate lyase [Jannaschia donghaensis]|uniref:Ureidoglycolate hydrolase n=1 Tax=Jannaschia donghaensis TaxID=420998 RepID=A0A0M6YEP6_9RHOB|nr:ureidoglycolate lyase [Jannaschia donghaensis]CTQ48821.1 Ureidoglycolate hydrolase [Jannaschia donghaensis]
MSRVIVAHPLTADAFAPYGDVLDVAGAADKIINAGLCGRYHDRAKLNFTDGRAGISLFDATPRALPYTLDLLERHPDGSQCFVPMHSKAWLVTVAPDDGGVPGMPVAFIVGAGQAVNLYRGTWHGVLTPLAAPGLFAVIDRIGPGANLEEYALADPYIVTADA